MELSAEKLRQLFLVRVLFICTIGFLGTSVILLGPFRTTSEQTLQSLLAIGVGVVASVAVTMPMLTNRWRTLGYVAYISILFAVAITLLLIWIPRYSWPARDHYNPEGVVVGAWALSGCFVLNALTSLARLKRQWLWVRRATLILAALLTIQLATLALQFYGLPDAWFQLMATLTILCGCGCVTIPILHQTGNAKVTPVLLTSGVSFSMTCPRCNRSQEFSAGRSSCTGCGLKITIEIEEEHCEKCGYPLYQIRSGACPECGTPFLETSAALPDATPAT
ncbi:MAG: hypothetical protein HS101_18980 [Planctomycetia bacterium]|jgi:uncharacterized Zn finger protein (UPF0148 family)|nr:hypothetical protein [Planctomycetia bacterium]MCC7313944.1 hypothetical protein [Planctomycetota bacterium]OQZ05285.1 MAG: hypothetical protein B6D36_10940 [Planctomycetes bacterium UTPLA1]